MRKPRKDAVLQNLPEERQDQIVKWLKTAEVKDAEGNVIQPGGQDLALAQLAADGIKVSEPQLSRFWRWYQLDRRYSGMRQTADQLQDMAVAKGVPLEKARQLAQGMFTLQALQANDPETFISLQQLDLDQRSAETKAKFKREELDLKRKQFEMEIAEKMLDEALLRRAQEIAGSGMTQAAKIAAMRKAAFADVDALEASGKIEIPRDK
jgi:DNA uptake protein ComE-like DNA-binding protein